MNTPSSTPALQEALEKAHHSIGFCIDELQAASRALCAPITDHSSLLICIRDATNLRRRIEIVQAANAPLQPHEFHEPTLLIDLSVQQLAHLDLGLQRALDVRILRDPIVSGCPHYLVLIKGDPNPAPIRTLESNATVADAWNTAKSMSEGNAPEQPIK